MERNNSYSSYQTVSLVIPLVFLTAIPTLAFLVGITLLLCKDLCLKENKHLQLWTTVFKIVKHVYGDQLEKKGKCYTLYGGLKVSKIKLLCLFLAVIVIYTCVIISFWSQLLVAESSVCDATKDCFALNPTSLEVVQESPLKENCTKFMDGGYIIVCYMFTFNYVDAIGNSGSVLIIGALFMNTQSALVYGILALFAKKRILQAIALYLYLIISTVVFFMAFFVLFAVPVTFAAISDSDEAIIQFFAYSSTFLFAFLASGPFFLILNCPPCNVNNLYYIESEEERSANSV